MSDIHEVATLTSKGQITLPADPTGAGCGHRWQVAFDLRLAKSS